jgi:hypothetical protein
MSSWANRGVITRRGIIQTPKSHMKRNVLFLNHQQSLCGVYWYGFRLYNIWKKSNEVNFHYKEVSNIKDYSTINRADFDIIIYNYHHMTMSWLNSSVLIKNIKSIGIWHEGPNNVAFNHILDVSTKIPRPIYEDIPTNIESTDTDIIEFINYSNESIPIIGSFGFGFDSKGFDKIITKVCNEFDKAIIKLIITTSKFGDIDGSIARKINERCNEFITNKNIELKIINTFLSDNDILYFLSKNTINMFLYDKGQDRGLSSVIDFAFSVNTPVCISNSHMFRHVYNDNISIEHNSISDCIHSDLKYIYNFREKNSYQNSINFINRILHSYI